jgi:hypothetical protein
MKIDINESRNSEIIRIQKNLIMMDFDIEMINKIILYFNIESEDQAIDYLTKNSEGFWQHPFIEKINDNSDKEIIDKISEDSGIIKGVTTKIKEIKDKGITNIYQSLTNESHISGDSVESLPVCEICGEPENLHLHVKNDNDILNDDFKNEIDENINIHIDNYDHDNIDVNFDELNNEEVNNNNINNNINNNNENNICSICLGEITDPIEIETCHHKYCKECFVEYLLDLIKNKNIEKIPCPTKNCFEKEISEDFFSQYLTEEEYFKYRTIRSQIDILKDPKKMFCPFCDSYASIPYENFIIDPNDSKYIKTTMTCLNGHNFCSCGIALHEGDCYKDSNDFQKFLIKENVKQCPKCGFYIKKLRGCNHMTCGNSACKFEFCWLCMQEAVPGHFEYGKCKGMQFVDTTSCSHKLKINHPFLYKLYNLIVYILVYGIFFLIPSLLFIVLFFFTFLICYKDYMKNNCVKCFYVLASIFMLFAINNIGHCILGFFILILLLAQFCKIVYSILKLVNKFKSIRITNPI